MKKKLVSILIPVFNREFLITDTVKSAIKQTYPNIEIIVVDNCSTDNTWEVLENLSNNDNRIKIYRNSENLGPVLNWGVCLQKAKGYYAKFLFSDDLIEENYLSETTKLFDEDTAFVLSKIQKFDSDGNYKTITKYRNNKIFSTQEYLQDLVLLNKYQFPVSPGCALFRLDELKNALIVDIENNLNLNFRKFGAGNDLLLYMNTLSKYKYIKTTEETISYFRYHNESFTVANALSDYYDYSKYYYLKKNNSNLLSKFKSKLLVGNFKNKNKGEFLKEMECKYDLFFLMKYIVLQSINKIVKK